MTWMLPDEADTDLHRSLECTLPKHLHSPIRDQLSKVCRSIVQSDIIVDLQHTINNIDLRRDLPRSRSSMSMVDHRNAYRITFDDFPITLQQIGCSIEQQKRWFRIRTQLLSISISDSTDGHAWISFVPLIGRLVRVMTLSTILWTFSTQESDSARTPVGIE